ncbi:MAG: ATP-dependent DNA helicase RecG [Thermoanaerobaculia bacterium]
MENSFYDKPLRYIKGIGPKLAEKFSSEGFLRVWDLLLHLPFRYEDRRDVVPISYLKVPNKKYCIRGRVFAKEKFRARFRNLIVVKILVADSTGMITVNFYNQPYLLDIFKLDEEYYFYGKLKFKKGISLENPHWELVAKPKGRTGKLYPIYPSIGDFKPSKVALFLQKVMENLPEEEPYSIPQDLLEKNSLRKIYESFRYLHNPSDLEKNEKGRERLSFDEFFAYFLYLSLYRKERDETFEGPKIEINDEIRKKVREVLPFKLTEDQKKVLKEIASDLSSSKPMYRLLQGDVGCGKTIIALISSIIALENGYQVAFMAPTSILAEQHFERFSKTLKSLNYKIEILTGGTKQKKRKEILKILKEREPILLIGTHALISENVEIPNLGLCIIDEEHKFGVIQRQILREKKFIPHTLYMTATPIPRSLTLTLYGDMDISIIKEMLPGRGKIRTFVRDLSVLEKVYLFVEKKLKEGRQAFFIYPIIEESEAFELPALEEFLNQVRSYFKNFSIEMLHGRMDYKLKDEIMKRFSEGKIDILVSTPVVEVGVDVPNATVMVIHFGERFGLAQLHQLRGRIGRSSYDAYCIVISNNNLTEEGKKRLESFERIKDGFELSEVDLELRGPGDLLGTRQWGIPKFKVADIIKDKSILLKARNAAMEYLEKAGTYEAKILLKNLLNYWDFKEVL